MHSSASSWPCWSTVSYSRTTVPVWNRWLIHHTPFRRSAIDDVRAADGGGILNILVVADGTAGDVHPLLGLSTVFASQGHSVSFFTNPVFADVVERCGLRFVPTGTAEDYRALRAP